MKYVIPFSFFENNNSKMNKGKYCSKCKKLNKTTTKFCRECGCKFSGEEKEHDFGGKPLPI